MSSANHQIVRKFIDAMSNGNITDDLVTSDFHVWIVAAEEIFEKDVFVSGIANLPKVFPDKLKFTIHSLTEEEDRVVAEFSGLGTTVGGAVYRNDYLYLFRFRDGKICRLSEFLNLDAMRGTLVAAMDALNQ